MPCQGQSLSLWDSQSTNLENNPSKSKAQKDCDFRDISKHFAYVLRHGGCHEADGAVRWVHVLSLLEDAEQTQTWDKENWIDALLQRTQTGESGGPSRNVSLHSCISTPQSWGHHQCKRLFETDTVSLERTKTPQGQFIQLQINIRAWSMETRFESEKPKTGLFLVGSEPAGTVIATASTKRHHTRVRSHCSCTSRGIVLNASRNLDGSGAVADDGLWERRLSVSPLWWCLGHQQSWRACRNK